MITGILMGEKPIVLNAMLHKQRVIKQGYITYNNGPAVRLSTDPNPAVDNGIHKASTKVNADTKQILLLKIVF